MWEKIKESAIVFEFLFYFLKWSSRRNGARIWADKMNGKN